MITPRLRKHLESLWESFWLLPLMMLSAGVLAGVYLPVLDAAVSEDVERMPQWLSSSASGARSILSASATALATVLAIAFAMTMLTMQLASTQFTSRLLRRFMRDGITKFVLGLFLATVAFLLVVLRAVRSREDGTESFVPAISVMIGISLTMACLAALLVTLHRTTRSLQAATVIVSIGRETAAELAASWDDWQESEAPQAQVRSRGRTLHAVETGYLQAIDIERVVKALPGGVQWVTIEQAIGSFVFSGIPLFSYGPAGDSAVSSEGINGDAMHRAFAVGRERTLARDPLYGVRQLVDIALKALSPAVNDPTTAVMVVNQLGALVSAALQQRLPLEPWASRSIGATRVYRPMVAIRPLLDEAYDELVACSRTQPRVLLRVAETLWAAAEAGEGAEPGRSAVRHRAAAVRRVAGAVQPGWREGL